VNLRSLEYFVAVAHHRGFTRAAEQLRIAQPAISRQIQGLEAELGVALFSRTRNGVQLTGAGAFFLKKTLPILEELRQAKEILARQSRAEIADLVIGLTTGEGLTVGSTLIRRWKETFPAANLRIVEGLAPLIYSGMRNGSFHLGIAPEPLEFDRIWTKPLFVEPLVLITPHEAPPSLPRIDRPVIDDVGFLLELPLISPSLPNPLRLNIENIARSCGSKANIAIELDSMSIIKDLVRRGIGYALTTYAHISSEIEHNMIRVIEINAPGCQPNVSLFGLEGGDSPLAGSETVRFLCDVVREIVDAGHWPGASLLAAGKP